MVAGAESMRIAALFVAPEERERGTRPAIAGTMQRIALVASLVVAACTGEGPGAGSSGGGSFDVDASVSGLTDGGTADPDAAVVDPGIEPAGASRRFDLVSPMCTVDLFDSGAGCPATDDKCLCKPEFNALNPLKGSAGNANGRVVIIAQPQWGKRTDGTYAFDAYAAIKAKGNQVGHYVNELNPSMTCTLAQAWTPDKGCAGGSGCGWRCIRGEDWADKLIEKQIATFAGYAVPELMALNEAWSTIYDPGDPGIYYRQFLRDATMRLKARGRLPLLYVQQRTTAAGPFPLLKEISDHALIGVEAYLSGREIMMAPGQCAAPYDASNFCVQRYTAMRDAIRNSASPAIPYNRLVMLEHFGANTFRYTDPNGNAATAGWGRAYDDTTGSPTFGTPTTSNWILAIERRARATKALPSLGGVASYCFACNGSNTGSSNRVQFSTAWSSMQLP